MKSKNKREKSGEAARCLFRFLFGHQKGSRVWGKAPLLHLRGEKSI